jgi:hypothetical protein
VVEAEAALRVRHAALAVVERPAPAAAEAALARGLERDARAFERPLRLGDHHAAQDAARVQAQLDGGEGPP